MSDFSDDFSTISAGVALDTYDGDWERDATISGDVLEGSGNVSGSLAMDAGNGNPAAYGWNGTGAPTTDIDGIVGVRQQNTPAMVGMAVLGDGAGNAYVLCAGIDGMQIRRYDSGSPTTLASSGDTLSFDAVHDLNISVVVGASSVDLSIDIDGGTPLTYSDTDAGRHTSGIHGPFMSDPFDPDFGWLLDIDVVDQGAGGGGGGGGFQPGWAARGTVTVQVMGLAA